MCGSYSDRTRTACASFPRFPEHRAANRRGPVPCGGAFSSCAACASSAAPLADAEKSWRSWFDKRTMRFERLKHSASSQFCRSLILGSREAASRRMMRWMAPFHGVGFSILQAQRRARLLDLLIGRVDGRELLRRDIDELFRDTACDELVGVVFRDKLTVRGL